MENQLKTLLSNFINETKGVIAVAITDRDGLIISSEGAIDDVFVGGISAHIDSFIERIKTEFTEDARNKFFNITLIGDKKFAFCSQGSHSILTTIAEPSTSDVELRVFSEHIAGKVELVLERKENVSLEIPQIIKVLTKIKGGILPKGDYPTKVIITGDYSVGKTSLIKSFVENAFQENYISTLGCEISKKTLELSEETKISFIVWDIAGQREQMLPYRNKFYNGANAAFIVLDRTRPNNLESVEYWHKDIKKSISANIPIILVGNKSDLIDKIVISEDDIKSVANKLGFYYILTSAKTGENINDSFKYVAFKVLENL